MVDTYFRCSGSLESDGEVEIPVGMPGCASGGAWGEVRSVLKQALNILVAGEVLLHGQEGSAKRTDLLTSGSLGALHNINLDPALLAATVRFLL